MRARASTIVTRCPADCSAAAADKPANPAPITIIFGVGCVFIGRWVSPIALAALMPARTARLLGNPVMISLPAMSEFGEKRGVITQIMHSPCAARQARFDKRPAPSQLCIRFHCNRMQSMLAPKVPSIDTCFWEENMNKQLLVSVTLAAALSAASVSAQTVIRIAHAQPENSPLHEAMDHFKQTLEDRSEGSFEVEIFAGGQLGSVNEALDLVQSGNIQMATGASVLLSPSVPELGMLDQFLLFSDEEHARSTLDGPAGDSLNAAMEERGLAGMGFLELGFRSFTGNRPLDSLEAFDGFRMRSADNPVQIAAWRSIGAVPLPLAWGEIYSSLQQGLIDGQESALSSMVVERFYEVQSDVSLTGHIYWPEVWFANLDFVNSLSEQDRALMMEVAAETVSVQRDLVAAANAATLDQLTEAGLTVTELPAEDRQRMAETMNSAIEGLIRERVGDAFFDEFTAALSQ
jgi:tripartite ATP-independent transporter DctP family solute receptor